MTDEQDMYGAETNPEASGSAFWAAARRARAKLLGLRRSPPVSGVRGPFLTVTCKSCNRPFRSPMDETSVKTFENVVIRITYDCPYCHESNVYEIQDHYWGQSTTEGPS